jgi:hypothetical protein
VARTYNPITKQWEDDGLGESPVAAPPLEPVAAPEIAPPVEDLQAGAGGAGPIGTPENPMVATIAPQPKPASETTNTTQQASKGKATLEADAKLEAAQAAHDAVRPELTNVEVREDDAAATAAELQANERREQIERDKQAEEERRKFVESSRASDEAEIAEEKKKRQASGTAMQSYFDGRPGAEIFSRILQVVGGVAHAMSGKDGDSPVDRRLREYIAAHEKRLVADWEATKEANAKKKANRAAYEIELDRRRILAANQSMASIDLIKDDLAAAIAALSPEKRKKAQAVADAALAESRAQEERKAAAGYDRMNKNETTTRDFGPGDGGKPTEGTRKAAAQGGMALEAIADAIKAPPLSRGGLEKMTVNKRREKLGESAPLLDIMSGGAVTPAEGETEGLSDADKAALANNRHLNDTLIRLTSGANAPEGEVKSKQTEVTIQPGDGPAAKKKKLEIALRYVEGAGKMAGPNWTPDRKAEYEALKAQVGKIDTRTLRDVPTAKLREGLIKAGRAAAKDPAAQKAAEEITRELEARKGAK